MKLLPTALAIGLSLTALVSCVPAASGSGAIPRRDAEAMAARNVAVSMNLASLLSREMGRQVAPRLVDAWLSEAPSGRYSPYKQIGRSGSGNLFLVAVSEYDGDRISLVIYDDRGQEQDRGEPTAHYDFLVLKPTTHSFRVHMVNCSLPSSSACSVSIGLYRIEPR
ncbi:hypothetical protein Mlute_00846 [Meiothermus luteus]|uniref:Lipoprotein n=1 Tax=Meiothermus luteus TaxID=2026184 RepID=A0A399EXR0_9DEIN|nr:hypothetical protein Mlute_00846 [Meiothermus luteus]